MERWLVVVALAVLVIGALAWGLDRLLLGAERRGWIYWRRRKWSRSSVGMALLSLQTIFEPDKQHVIEEHVRQADDIDIAPDDDSLG